MKRTDREPAAGGSFELAVETLRAMTDAETYRRGERCSADGKVGPIDLRDDGIAAAVRGTRQYQTWLWHEAGGMRFSCTCPVGSDGILCEHCVALGLSWIRGELGGGSSPEVEIDDADFAGSPAAVRRLREYLSGKKKRVLVELLVDRAMEDDSFAKRLLLGAASEGVLDLPALRRTVKNIIVPADYVEDRDMFDYSRGLDSVVGLLERLVDSRRSAVAAELAEQAMHNIEEALTAVHDSGGYLGRTLEHLQDLHYRACRKTMPNGQALARRLFAWALSSEWDLFLDAAERYADVLGTAGLAEYTRLAEARWAQVRALGPGERDEDEYRFRITRIMELLAARSGILDDLVEVLRRNLSEPFSYLRIAELYEQAGEVDRSLAWAEEGMRTFPEHFDARLREFLAERYHRRERHAEEMELLWAEFASAPCLAQYEKLRVHADRDDQWDVWRERALSYVLERCAAGRAADRPSLSGGALRKDYSELVEIMLWEGDEESAWNYAQQGGCGEDLWIRLARAREAHHPDEVLPIYQRSIQPTLDQKNTAAYRSAVEQLWKVRELMTRLGREADFAGYVALLRAGNRAKRNFIKMLDNLGW